MRKLNLTPEEKKERRLQQQATYMRSYRERLAAQGKKTVTMIVDSSQPDPNQTNLVSDLNQVSLVSDQQESKKISELNQRISELEKDRELDRKCTTTFIWLRKYWRDLFFSLEKEFFVLFSVHESNIARFEKISGLIEQWRNNPKVNLYANSNKNLLTFIQQLEEVLE